MTSLNTNGELQAIIFDLDGVITDTAEYHYLAWKQLADEEGLTIRPAIERGLPGRHPPRVTDGCPGWPAGDGRAETSAHGS
jgi:beta-phosphoglucomutase-like phosphatase (HAD superfamily)